MKNACRRRKLRTSAKSSRTNLRRRVKYFSHGDTDVISIGSGPPHCAGIFQETNLRVADDASLLHGLPEVFGAGEATCPLEAVPIQKNRDLARVIHRLQDAIIGLARRLPGIKMRVKSLFPARIVRDFMPNNHVNHEESSA